MQDFAIERGMFRYIGRDVSFLRVISVNTYRSSKLLNLPSYLELADALSKSSDKNRLVV